MGNRNASQPTVFLKSGTIYLGLEPTVVSTVLGSCVAVTMFSPRKRIGAVCHAVLPGSGGGSNLKYVDDSIRSMVESLGQQGVRPAAIDVKLFGGARVLPYREEEGASGGGQRNIDTALALIIEMGLKLAYSDVGGVRGRQILFLTHTGEVFLKHLTKNLYESFMDKKER